MVETKNMSSQKQLGTWQLAATEMRTNISITRGIVSVGRNSPKMGPIHPGRIHVHTANTRNYQIQPLISKIISLDPTAEKLTNSIVSKLRKNTYFRRVTTALTCSK